MLMTNIELLEKQIADLDYDSFAKLREWFLEFDQTIFGSKTRIGFQRW